LGNENVPLVFAGVDYLFPMFRLVDVYRNTLNETIEGNPDTLDFQELVKRGRQIVSPYFQKEQQHAIERYRDLLKGSLTSDRVEKVVAGAIAGRVDTLFVDTEARKWGSYDSGSGLVEVHAEQQDGDEDLLDLAFVQTYLNGGNVYALDPEKMPGTSGAAAIFRY
jgi:hypothetical protein